MADRDLEFFEDLAALKRAGRQFAVARVISRRSPVSSHLGDRAIILSDGQMRGFVGGACSREIVRKQALEAITARAPRLVQIRPTGVPADPTLNANQVVVPMSCASEGAVDISIEPYPLAPLLLIAGLSPVAEALERMARAVEWDCVRLVSAEEAADLPADTTGLVTLHGLDRYLHDLAASGRPLDAAVIASQGHYDELVLEALLRGEPGYTGLVASRKRGAVVREVLLDRGSRPEAVAAIRNPAGLAIGAHAPGEVAVSILAEIVQRRPAEIHAFRTDPAEVAPHTAVDPVCRMEVEIAGARHISEHEGRRYYFCCPACKRSFEREPARYLVPLGTA